MSKKANPTLIGAFVVGAVALLAVGAALLGGSEYFAKRLVYVAYFDESTKGLRAGSNVLLNGVRVGYVSDIALLVDQSTHLTLTQVTLEIHPEDLVVTDFGEVVHTVERRTPIGPDDMVENAGLRAQLEMESFVTGQLNVRLDMRPETPAIFRGVHPPHQEIPTIPSSAQAFLIKMREWAERIGDDFDLEEIAVRFNNILIGIEEFTNSQDLRDSLAGLKQLLNDDKLQQLAANVDLTLGEVRAAATDARSLLQNADAQVGTLAEELRPSLERLAIVMEETEHTLAAAKDQLRGESVQMYQLQLTLEEIESAAFALREFFDLMERNPEALLSG
ncbi:MAG: MlaD family protein, partial [Xanthomonadales bacterium]|nr:MlaD family protein [Xanthomonadales bacterium]